MAGLMAGQTINDRLLAARHSLAGQGLAKSVCKATTEEMIGPKKKHLDCEYILLFNFHHWGLAIWQCPGTFHSENCNKKIVQYFS
jgi:hypothetical protein